MFYIDDNYDRNESLKLIRMKEQYNRGMRSPLMYYESLMVYNETPSLLRVMDDYEKQVIAYGISENYISENLRLISSPHKDINLSASVSTILFHRHRKPLFSFYWNRHKPKD